MEFKKYEYELYYFHCSVKNVFCFKIKKTIKIPSILSNSQHALAMIIILKPLKTVEHVAQRIWRLDVTPQGKLSPGEHC